MRLFLVTTLAMIAFAANSILARLALGAGAIDPAAYTAIRLAAGAVVLVLLVALRETKPGAAVSGHGNWISAIALFAYAAAFSFAYVVLTTGTGALIPFATVQSAMVGWGVFKGDRPGIAEWAGIVTAFGAFAWLVSPGLAAPDPLGSALMAVAGVAWAVYSLRGRGAADPLRSTAQNFLRAVPAGLALAAVFAARLDVSWYGVAMAVLSGAVASGMGYAVWYTALKQLQAVQAAVVQLTVPVIAAFAGILFVGEAMSVRLAVCSALILGGIALATLAKRRRQVSE